MKTNIVHDIFVNSSSINIFETNVEQIKIRFMFSNFFLENMMLMR